MDKRKGCHFLRRGGMLLDFTHPELNCEITAIGGYYLFLKEVSFPYQGQTILYLVGCAVFNNTCCGAGGISYAQVQGFLHRYRYKTEPSGAQVSLIEPIINPQHQEKVRKIIQEKEMVHQVEFS
jgi:hypothetical protein